MKNNFQHFEILERISDAFVALDKNWCFTFANKTAAAKLNSIPDELIGKNIWKLFPETVNLPFHKAFLEAMETQQYVFLEEYYPPLNKWFENHIYPSSDGLSIYFRDVTEKKKEEEIIKKSITELSNYKFALNESSLVSITDRQGIINYVSDSFCKITQYSSNELLSKNHRILSSGFHTKDFFKELWSTILKGKTWKGEIKDKTKDGNFIWLDTTIVPFINETGQPFQFVAIRKDSTDRKKAEEEVKESELHYSSIIEQATDAIFVVGANFNYLDINPSGCELTGYSKEEFIRLTPIDLVFEEDLKTNPFMKEGLLAGKIMRYERRLKRKDGQAVDVEVSSKIMEDKKALIFVRDITDRKKAEKKLISSEAQYRRLFETAKDGILILNAVSGEIEDVNNFLIKLLGYSHNEFLGKEVWEISLFKDIFANKESFIKLQKEGYIRYDNHPLETKDGHKIWVEFVSNAYDVNGKQVIQCNIRDISERKKVEQEILQKNKELKELTAYLQNIREDERKNIAREIHDELGQQLAAIKIDAKWISKNAEKKELLKNKTDEMLLQIDETIKTIRKITSELRPEILDELGLLAAIEWKAEKFYNRTGIKCNFQSNCGELDLPSYFSINIFRIIQESLFNIAKHSEATEVTINLKVENKNLIILISDNGKGFDSKKIKNKNSFGLIGMKERAEMMGGNVKIISQVKKARLLRYGRGTTVELIVPVG